MGESRLAGKFCLREDNFAIKSGRGRGRLRGGMGGKALRHEIVWIRMDRSAEKMGSIKHGGERMGLEGRFDKVDF